MLTAGLLLAVLGALVSSAAGQGCPSNICDAYFANALGGPVDCCNHNFATSSKCQWGGTPVSFTRARTCTADGKQYTVLQPSNFQGPGGMSLCRCSNPTTTTLTPQPTAVTRSVKMTVELRANANEDIKGFDLPCDGQSFCKVCGGLQGLQAACASRGRCVAFTWEPATNCGYLKTAAGPRNTRGGWVVYARA